MFVCVLVSTGGALTAEPGMSEALRNAWGGGDLIWLDPNDAAEFALPERPDNFWDVWEELQERRVDMAIVPASGRRKRLLIADMDSTMIRQECIDELADVAGLGERVKAITARAMNGELEFEAALEERVALLRGLPQGVITEVLSTRITYTAGGHSLVRAMRGAGSHAALVSGGFTAFTAAVAAELGFDEHRANTLLSEAGVLTGQVARPILGREAKVQALREITARLGVTPADAIAVGDGANDLGMLHAAGMGVAMHAKPSVAAQCDIRINHGDLTALLYLQGYSASDINGGSV